MSDWETRKQARIERFKNYAENAKKRSETRFSTAGKMASFIPMGQPILVGHHSEKSDRAYRKRIDNNMRKGVEEGKKASYWEDRAASAESNTAIFKQDPEAVTKLREKIKELEKHQATMKAVNKAIRTKDDGALVALGLSAQQITELKKPDFCGRVGYPGYALTNNNANIRRLRGRLASLEREQARPETEIQAGGATVRENSEYGSVEIHFPGKPDQAVIDRLKRAGFKWARVSKCWYKNRRDDYTLKLAQEIAGAASSVAGEGQGDETQGE